MKTPWVSRWDLDETVKFYDAWVNDLAAENAKLTERIAYLERERETFRVASLTPEPKPITELHPLPVDEDVARWEGDGGSAWNA